VKDWIPSEGASEELRPRPLTAAEISEILSEFPMPSSTDSVTSLNIQRELIEGIRTQLEEIELVPTQEARKKLKEQLVVHYYTSIIRTGVNVGITTASAIGSVLMQMTLDTFHKAGDISGVGSGLKGMENILYAVKERRDHHCTIHFRTPVTKYDVVDLIPLMVELKFASLIKGKPEYLPYQNEDQMKDVRGWWYRVHEVTVGALPSVGYVMRLHLDTDKMYKHRVTMSDISSNLEGNFNVIVVIAPLKMGFVDIFADLVGIGEEGITTSTAQLYYLQYEVLPSISNLRIKGIPRITDLHPVEVSVLSLLSEDRRLSRTYIDTYGLLEHPSIPPKPSEGEDLRYLHFWRNEINLSKLRGNGIHVNSIIMLMRYSGIIILSAKRNNYGGWPISGSLHPPPEQNEGKGESQIVELTCYVPGEDEKIGPSSHLSSWTGMVNGINVNSYSERELSLLPEPWKRVPNFDDEGVKRELLQYLKNEVSMLSTYTYAVTDGSNLMEIFKFPWIDTSRSYSNNMYEMNNLLGCEAARSYAAYELSEVLALSGISINSRHITIILDFMFTRGFPLGVRSSAAMTRSSRNFLSNSTTDRTFGIYVNSSRYQLTEMMGSVPASLMVGELPRIGDNVFHHFPTVEDVRKERARIEEERTRHLLPMEGGQIDPGSFQQAMNERNAFTVQEEGREAGEAATSVTSATSATSAFTKENEPSSSTPKPSGPGTGTIPPVPISGEMAAYLRRMVSGWVPLSLTTFNSPPPAEEVIFCAPPSPSVPGTAATGVEKSQIEKIISQAKEGGYVPLEPPRMPQNPFTSPLPAEVVQWISERFIELPTPEMSPFLGIISRETLQTTPSTSYPANMPPYSQPLVPQIDIIDVTKLELELKNMEVSRP